MEAARGARRASLPEGLARHAREPPPPSEMSPPSPVTPPCVGRGGGHGCPGHRRAFGVCLACAHCTNLRDRVRLYFQSTSLEQRGEGKAGDVARRGQRRSAQGLAFRITGWACPVRRVCPPPALGGYVRDRPEPRLVQGWTDPCLLGPLLARGRDLRRSERASALLSRLCPGLSLATNVWLIRMLRLGDK